MGCIRNTQSKAHHRLTASEINSGIEEALKMMLNEQNTAWYFCGFFSFLLLSIAGWLSGH